MVGFTNSITGAGTAGDDKVSLLWITYPAGYTCVCSGKDTYTSDDTSGNCMFEIRRPGSYMTSINDSDDEYPPISVEVSKLGSLRAIRMKRWGEYHPIRSGEVSSMYTIGFKKNNNSCTYELTDTGPKIHSPAASSSWCEGYFEEPIYLKPEWTKMVVTMTGRGYCLTAGLMTDLSLAYTSTTGNMIVYKDGGRATTRTNQVYEIDISSLTEIINPNDPSTYTFYFAFRTAGSGADNYVGNLTINDLYFE